jgi:hypothetical protein
MIFMKMKAIFVFALFAIVFFTGCQSGPKPPIVYDPSVSPEKHCSLNIYPSLTVIRFDDKFVNWRAGNNIQIPEGFHTLAVNYSEVARTNTRGEALAWNEAKGIVVTYNFVAGKNYRLVGETTDKTVTVTVQE